MPSFILRGLDPDFWSRVQAKAKADGTTVKAVILQLLTTWLGVVVLALLTAACSDVKSASMTAPSPAPPAAAVASTITLTAVSGIGGSAGTVYLNAIVKDASGRGVGAAVVHYTTTAGTMQHADVTADAGGQAQAVMTTSADATITATSGSAISTLAVSPTALPAPIVPTPPVLSPVPPPFVLPPSVAPVIPPTPAPTPSPTPTPVAPVLAASMTCSPVAHGSPTPCNVAVTYGGANVQSTNITKVDFDWGDGTSLIVNSSPLGTHTYAQAGTYLVGASVTATTTDGSKMAFTSQSIVVP